MTETVYLRPIALAESPQGEAGDAVRLGGSLAWASRFALIRRKDGRVVARQRLDVSEVPAAIAALPDALAMEAQAQWRDLARPHAPLSCGPRVLRFDQPLVMGILNVTPDSFSDGGKFLDKPDAAIEHGHAMLEAGAALIDVGGESTRPGAAAVWEGDEERRIVPVIERLATAGAAISIDSRRASVIGAALSAGGHIVNDVSAMRHDPRTVELVAQSGAPVVLMHAPGDDGDLHADGVYRDVVLDVFDALRERRDAALAAGIAREKILLDPGIGFGKNLAENLALINAMPLLHALGQPILFAASRKRLIGALAGEVAAHKRMPGSLTLALKAADAGSHMVRVHDVPETVQALQVWRGLRDAALTDFSQIVD
ncbi:dihydropteroate synthase [Novosphingobium nitrogenifigens DSM 19370]|uniref:dihydropteroate synthase n=1 Tax=Novosphingobium nitrogenifigens DSM 19370 TaxID=983920 RepID=F1ZA38_9SPHN|nr:dihydropteroate synthase [Novosphingobium nitrogenifigens]EGD58554.1 dihydropteroate synthase [Novosphingobium nitrogenifigens DSM 19370]